MLLGNESVIGNIDPQSVTVDLEMETNGRSAENTNLNIISQDIISDLIFCNVCKRNRASSLFTGRIHSKTYKSCSDCRLRVNTRRRPHSFRASTNTETHLLSPGKLLITYYLKKKKTKKYICICI